MRMEKFRFFLINGVKVYESITMILSGTEGVSPNDSRCEAMGETVIHPKTGLPTDNWLPISIQNPAFDSSAMINATYKQKSKVDDDEFSPTFGQLIQYSVIDKVNSVNLNCYSFPLKPGYTQITEAQFNDPLFP